MVFIVAPPDPPRPPRSGGSRSPGSAQAYGSAVSQLMLTFPGTCHRVASLPSAAYRAVFSRAYG